MKRPLFWVCLCLVAAASLRLAAGPPGGREDCLGVSDGEAVIVTGRVYRKDDDNFYLTSIEILSDEILLDAADQQRTISITENLLCEWAEKDGREPASQMLRLGSTVTVQGIFRTFPHAANPGEFDAASYYRSLRIGGKLSEAQVLTESKEYSRLQETLFALREYWRGRLYRIFPEKEASVMSAMLLGDKEGLDQEIRELYQRNGIIHILSISGLHITMIGMGVYKLLRRMGIPAWLAAVCGGGILLLYGIMTGLGISACRAIGMYLIRMLAEIVGRTYDMLTTLGVLAAVMAWKNPWYLQNSGFLLSFGSILGIGVLCPILTSKEETEEKRYEEKKWKRILSRIRKTGMDGLKQSIITGLSVTLATLPIQLWFYYEVPAYSIAVNLLILPFMSLLMTAGIVAMTVPGLGVIGTVDCVILMGYEKICQSFDRLPFHTWNPGRPQGWQAAAYYGILLFLVWMESEKGSRKGACKKDRKNNGKKNRKNNEENHSKNRSKMKRKSRNDEKIGRGINPKVDEKANEEMNKKRNEKICRKARLILGVIIGIAILSVRFPQGNTVTFLDVGQGDGICLRTQGGEVYLFDCGSSSRSRVGNYVLKPFLKYYGIHHIDAVFVSHTDADHCNGIEELLQNGREWGITVDQLLLSKQDPDLIRAALEGAEGTLISYVHAGDSWQSGEISLTCLHPPMGYGTEDANAGSQCFYLEIGEQSLLLTGDVEGEGEERLLEEMKRQGIRQVTVLKAAHHGSRGSTSQDFLEQAAPVLTIISCGQNNRYGHPHAETLKRLERSGSLILKTSEQGAVTLRFGKKGVEVRPQNQAKEE